MSDLRVTHMQSLRTSAADISAACDSIRQLKSHWRVGTPEHTALAKVFGDLCVTRAGLNDCIAQAAALELTGQRMEKPKTLPTAKPVEELPIFGAAARASSLRPQFDRQMAAANDHTFDDDEN